MTNMNPKLCSTHRKLRGTDREQQREGPRAEVCSCPGPLPAPIPFPALIPSDHGMGSHLLVCAHLGTSVRSHPLGTVCRACLAAALVRTNVLKKTSSVTPEGRQEEQEGTPPGIASLSPGLFP